MKIQDLKKIEDKVREFFTKMGFIPLSLSLKAQDQTLQIKLNIEEAKLLIGERGQTLLETQRILKLILYKEFFNDQKEKNFLFIDLDINDYKIKKIRALRELAKEIANEVALKKEQRILDPMPAYERRIIHLELAERSDVTTQSVGQGKDRRIIISPV